MVCFLVCRVIRGNQEKDDTVQRNKQLWLLLSPFLFFLVRADRVMCHRDTEQAHSEIQHTMNTNMSGGTE